LSLSFFLSLSVFLPILHPTHHVLSCHYPPFPPHQDATDAAPPILLTLARRARTVVVRFGVARPRMVVGGSWLSLHAFFLEPVASAAQSASTEYRAAAAMIAHADAKLREEEAVRRAK
jgi:hypothetical protein